MGVVEQMNESTLETEYNEIMKGFQQPTVPVQPVSPWTRPNDFIVKFSLYSELPNSITSTETSVNLTGW
jgi:hypothetical protein